MKGLVLVFLLIQCTLIFGGLRPSFVTDGMIDIASSVVNACQTQTGVSPADIEGVRNGKWANVQPLKCYMFCLWEQFGLIDGNNELDINGMLTFFQRIPAYRNEVSIALRECNGVAKDTGIYSTPYSLFRKVI